MVLLLMLSLLFLISSRKITICPFEVEDGCGKGWNWGKVDIRTEQNDSLKFSVSGKVGFSIPIKQVTNAMVVGQNELVVEFGQNGASIVPVDDKDEVVSEIRFYIPSNKEEKAIEIDEEENENEVSETGNISEEEKLVNENDDDNEESVPESEEEENIAQNILNQIKAISSFSKISSNVIASLTELSCAVPRGRYNFDMFGTFLRLHGKSYDYKIEYNSINKLFLLPKPDDSHIFLVLALSTPIRQGQTRYPFIIVQFPKDEKIDQFNLENITEDELKTKYEGKLNLKYEDIATFELVSMLFRVLAGQKIIVPGGSFKSSFGPSSCLKCAYKANEGLLYNLEKNFLFLTKPTILIPHSDISHIGLMRCDSAISFKNPRSFDIKIGLKSGVVTEYPFSNLMKDELENFVDYLKIKEISFSMNSQEDRIRGSRESEDDSDSDESDYGKKKLKTESGDEEDESTDEDYVEGEETEDEENQDSSESNEDFEDDSEDDE
jgi:structure-specific recognition protein 1